jgi:hypothetical protein
VTPAFPKPATRPKAVRVPIARRVAPKRSRIKRRSTLPGAMAAGADLRKAREVLADELWRRIIWSKAPDGRCARCRYQRGLQAMHIFSRRFKSGGLRWLVENGIPGCPGCHQYLGHDHEAHRDFAICYVGRQEYERMKLMKDGRGKADMAAVLLYLWAEASRRGLPVADWRQELAAKIAATEQRG